MATIAELGIKVDTSSVTTATGNLNKLSVAANSAELKANKSSEALGQFGRKAGQAGIQVQQLVGQIQGGQNVFGAVSAQATDLGFVFGFPLLGAVVGIAAAFSGPLFSALFGAGDGIDKLKNDLDDLTDNFDTAADGSYRLSEELVRLAMLSEESAKLKISIETESARKNLLALGGAMRESFADLTGDITLTAIDKLNGLTFSDKLAENLKITKNEAKELQAAFVGAVQSQDAASYSNFASVIDGLSKTYGRNNSAVSALKVEMAEFIETGVIAADNYKKLTSAGTDWEALLKKSGGSDKAHATAIQKINEALKEELATTGATAAQVTAYHLEKMKATEAERAQVMALQDTIDKKKALIESEKEAVKYANALSLAQATSIANAQKNAQVSFDALAASQRDQLQVIEDRYLQEHAIIANALGAEVITVEQANAAKLKSDKAYAQSSAQLDAQQAQSRQAVFDAHISAMSTFAAASLEALEAYGAESSNLGIAMLAVTKGLSIAQAIMAAEMSYVMTKVAYASAAAFAGPGAPAVLAAGEGAAQINRAIGYASAALIAATAFAPARALGGQVQPGETYTVGENGPEQLTMGSMGGHITSNANSQGKGDTYVMQLSTGVTGTVRAEMAAMMPMIMKTVSQTVRSARR